MATPRRLVEAVEVTESRVHIIRLKNIFDASTVDEFEKVIAYLLARDFYRIIVDLGHVEFISSAGWGAFTAELRRVRQNRGDIKIAGMSQDVYDVFLLLELDSFIAAYETVDEAIAAFAPPLPAVAASSPPPVPPPVAAELEVARSEEFRDEAVQESADSPALTLPEEGGDDDRTNHEDSEIDGITSPAESLDTALPLAAANEPDMWDTFAELENATLLSTIPKVPKPLDAETSPHKPKDIDSISDNADEGEFEEFETQDIRDPWILDEIDTLPEEDENTSEDGLYQESVSDELLEESSEFDSRGSASSSDKDDIEEVAPESESRTGEQFDTRLQLESSSEGTTMAADDVQTEPIIQRTGEEENTVIEDDTNQAASTSQSQRAAFPKLQMNGRLDELLRHIIFEHPHYGPTMLRKFLEARVEPPVIVSRSTVYRHLRKADLNTREKRLAFAGRART